MSCFSSRFSICFFTALYLVWGIFCAVWSRVVELPYECEHPTLPVNQSGVKVLVAGLAKSGTRTLSRSLYQIGYDHSYHSEEFGMFFFANLADKYWLRQNGGHWSQLPKPGTLHNTNTQDLEVLRGTSPEELAAALSRCRVDAIALDGIEQIFWPVYDVSPDAKVVLLNWRTFKEWRTSLEAFVPLLMLELLIMGTFGTAMTVLPWGALLHVIDPLLMGRKIEKMMKSGGPPICQVYDTYTSMWHGIINGRRIATRWFSGINFTPGEEAGYDAWHADIKAKVPKERLLEWDMRKHRFEDLCAFLEMPDCPRQGRLPRAPNVFLFAQDFPHVFFCKMPMLALLHWINIKIFRKIFTIPAMLVRSRSKAD